MPPAHATFSLTATFMNVAEIGAEWVMWVLIGLGFLLIVISVERARLYVATRVDAPDIARHLVGLLDAGKLDDARRLVASGRAMEERVLADALEAYPRGAHVVKQVMAGSLARERKRYDRYLGFFGSVGSNAPFIGLLGTVIGIIMAFKALGANPKGGLEVVGPAIAEALVATAVGLFVAIPAVILYNAFKGVQRDRLNNTDFLGRIVLAQLARDVDAQDE
jgi:biopolymer transport protein ExbB